ncbi:MAG: hypothetical protein LBD20_07635 [Spirochaetaceae bacterium]|jgi:TolA-binding protein|nr:hypothetical protein [Spirochaetaceae bacterium]
MKNIAIIILKALLLPVFILARILLRTNDLFEGTPESRHEPFFDIDMRTHANETDARIAELGAQLSQMQERVSELKSQALSHFQKLENTLARVEKTIAPKTDVSKQLTQKIAQKQKTQSIRL